MSDERTKRVANNKSLRLIKAELEALNERGFIDDQKFDEICSVLPAEVPLHGGLTPTGPPARTAAARAPSPHLASLSINDPVGNGPSTAPPAYQQTSSQPPQLPRRNEVGHAVALYRYNTPDPHDLNLEAGDHISVSEFVNNDWWMGKNIRTGAEGIFPRNYVRQEFAPTALAQPGLSPPGGYYGDQKNAMPAHSQPPQQGFFPAQQQQAYHPGPPAPNDPYANPVPPVAVAEQPTDQRPGKGQEMATKFGKKLGNAAIFGAGATIGSNIVNSIF